MSVLQEVLEDLMRYNVITWGKKEEPDRIHDDIQAATTLFTYVNINDGMLQPGLASYALPAYLQRV